MVILNAENNPRDKKRIRPVETICPYLTKTVSPGHWVFGDIPQ